MSPIHYLDEGGGETDRDTETDTHTERKKKTDTDRQTDRQTDQGYIQAIFESSAFSALETLISASAVPNRSVWVDNLRLC